MGNTVLRPINDTDLKDYFVDKEGFLWKKLLGNPRHTGNTCYRCYEGNWFILLKPSVSGKYKNYLAHNNGNITIRTHRAVLSAFNPVDGWELLQVNHKDRNTFNNSLDNLEWVTNKENAIHRFTVDMLDTVENLYTDWCIKWKIRHSKSDTYTPNSIGGQQIYDKDLIIELLYNSRLTLPNIALVTGASKRAVRYWQEKEKIKRPCLEDIVYILIKEYPSITNKELSYRTGSLVTSINSVLRKVKCNDYRKVNHLVE